MTEQNENVSSRKPGRPSQGEKPDVAWDQVDHLLVHGESLEEKESSLGCINYPSYRDLGQRFGVSHSLIAKYSQDHNCMQRRKYEHAKTNKQVLAEGELQQLLETQKPLNKKELLLITDYL
ncbi:MAG: hypothetical protein GY694_21125, partial [Gammaproteobacteria bacterium]|nr:hypothetical protein [Gammaproteobacteria bacterium]